MGERVNRIIVSAKYHQKADWCLWGEVWIPEVGDLFICFKITGKVFPNEKLSRYMSVRTRKRAGAVDLLFLLFNGVEEYIGYFFFLVSN